MIVCPICIEEISKDIIKLKCNHIFCVCCIMKVAPFSCPICRYKYNSTDLLDPYNLYKTIIWKNNYIKGIKTNTQIGYSKFNLDKYRLATCTSKTQIECVNFNLDKCIWCNKDKGIKNYNYLCKECWDFFLQNNDYNEFKLETPDGKAERRALTEYELESLINAFSIFRLEMGLCNKNINISLFNTFINSFITDICQRNLNDSFLLFKHYSEFKKMYICQSQNEEDVIEHLFLNRVIDRWNIKLNNKKSKINDIRKKYIVERPALILNSSFEIIQIDHNKINDIILTYNNISDYNQMINIGNNSMNYTEFVNILSGLGLQITTNSNNNIQANLSIIDNIMNNEYSSDISNIEYSDDN